MKRLVLAALALALSAGTAFAGLDENVMAPGGPGEFKRQGPVATVEAYSSLIYHHTRMDIFFAGAGRFDGGRARGGVEMTGNVDSPLARWAQSADERLAGCWADAKPAE